MLALRNERRQDSCQTHGTARISSRMKDEIIYARVPRELRSALERERKRMSKAAGAEVKTSAAIRAILEQKLLSKRRRATSERVAP